MALGGQLSQCAVVMFLVWLHVDGSERVSILVQVGSVCAL